LRLVAQLQVPDDKCAFTLEQAMGVFE